MLPLFANMNVMNNPNFINMNMNMNQAMGNSITEQEIQKHKNNINNLIFELNNTHNIDEEILINNEIKKENECLSSLLNIKKNELNQQNMMNNNIMPNMLNNNIIQNMMNNPNENNNWIGFNQMNIGEPIINKDPIQKVNVIFKDQRGHENNILVDFGTTINELLEKYVKIISRPDLIGENSMIFFTYNAKRICFGDQTKVESLLLLPITRIIVTTPDDSRYTRKNISFKTTCGINYKLEIIDWRPIGWLLKYYLVVVKKPELINDINNKIVFLYHGNKIESNSRIPIGGFFGNDNNPTIVVNDPNFLIK